MGISQNLQNSVDFYLALQNKDVKSAQTLLNKGFDSDYRYKIGYIEKPSICIAVENQDFDMCKLLIDFGVSVNQIDSNGLCPLLIACEHGNVCIVNLLLKFGANSLMVDYQNKSALHYAIQGKNIEIIKTLKDKGLDIDCIDFHKMTPLNLLCSNIKLNNKFDKKYLDILNLLIQNKASLVNFDVFNYTPLHYISMFDFTTFSNLLLENDLFIKLCFNIKNKYCETPMHMFIHNISCENSLYSQENVFAISSDIILQLFVIPPLDIKELNSIFKLSFIIKITYQKKFNQNITPLPLTSLDCQDSHGQTLLHQAIKINYLYYAEYLLRYGVNPFLKDKNHATVVHYICNKVKNCVNDILVSNPTSKEISVNNLNFIIHYLYILNLIYMKTLFFTKLPVELSKELVALVKKYVIDYIPQIKILMQSYGLSPSFNSFKIDDFEEIFMINKKFYTCPSLKSITRHLIHQNFGINVYKVIRPTSYVSKYPETQTFPDACNINQKLYSKYLIYFENFLPTHLKNYLLYF